MNKDGFKVKFDYWVDIVNRALDGYVAEKDTPEKIIYRAMRYSLMAGGKRLRPVLALSVCEMLGGNIEEVIPFACAIEMIHTYSLIHDDLPAMDNDDYRRGRLTNHKVFGEATAVLAGDALLNYAFEIMTAHMLHNSKDLLPKVKAMDIIAKAAGVSGMIGGQVVDLESEGKEIPRELLEYMHRCKTGALIKAPVLSAAVLCGADTEDMNSLVNFSENMGLAFQIKDDILDVEGNLAVMGKQTGSDAANGKSTFVTLYGLEESKAMLQGITEKAVECMERYGASADFLKELALFLVRIYIR